MTPAQQGVWIVQWALHRGQRHAHKQRIRARLSRRGRHADCMDFDEYVAAREARMGGTE